MPTNPQDIMQTIYDAVQKAVRVVVLNGGAPGGTVELGPGSLAALEEVQVNITGEGGLATETTLTSLLALLAPGVPEHRNGTATATPQQITFTGPTKHLVIQSTTPGGNLQVSFDGGSTYLHVIGRGQLAFPCRVTSLHLKSSGGPSGYRILATV